MSQPTKDAAERKNQSGLVTGANSGVGYEAAAQLAEAGWGKVILACRSIEKAEAARDRLVARVGKNPFPEGSTLRKESEQSDVSI